MIDATTLPSPPAQPLTNSDSESDTLRFIYECSGANDPHLYSMRASAYTQILYAHGLQSYAYSLTQGRMVDLREFGDDSLNVIFNVILPIVEGQKSLLLSRQPKRDIYPTTQDDRDIEAARYASDLLRWLDQTLCVEEVAAEAADWLVKTGNVILFDGWDPTGGRFLTTADGQMIFEGEPIHRAESIFAWAFHPHAKSVKHSPFAHNTSYVSRGWLEEHHPEIAADIPKDEAYATSSSQMFERALLNLSSSHSMFSVSGNGSEVPKGEGFYEIQTVYERSCPRYPEGRLLIALARGGTPYKLLFSGPNPYIDYASGRRTLPVTHIKLLSVPNRLWGESFVLHAMPHQRAINKTRSDLYANAHLNGNPTLYYVQDGIAPETLTNEIGSIVPIAPGSTPPGYLQAPEMPSYVIQGEAAALQFLDYMTRPVGPLSAEGEQHITSGVQQMIVEESKKLKIAPMVRAWEMGIDSSTKRRLDNWRAFQKMPKKIGVVGDVNGWRETYFSGEQASANFVVEIQPYSSMPMSRTATFAEWVELIKAGAAPIQLDPGMARQFWKDIGKPDMARTYRDNSADYDKAMFNISEIKAGRPRFWERMDNPETHISIYENWMKLGEYRKAIEIDPTLEFRANIMLDSFIAVQQAAMMQQQMQMAAVQGGKMGDENKNPIQAGAQAAMPGAPVGGNVPRMTQGFGRARNPVANNGGNPTGPVPR